MQSQVPGYMGKKFAVYYEPAISPAFYNSNDESYQLNDQNYGINFRNDFSADFTISRSKAIGISYKILHSKMINKVYELPIPENEYEIEYARYDGDVNLSTAMLGVYVKFFSFDKKGSIAPIGKYQKVELLVGKIKGTTGETHYYEPLNEFSDYLYLLNFEDLNFQKDAAFLGAIWSFAGVQTLFFDRLFITNNIQFGLLSCLDYRYIPFGISDSEFEQEYIDDAGYRVGGACFLNLSIGFGFLAF